MTFHLLGKCGRFDITLWPFSSVAVVDVHRAGHGRDHCKTADPTEMMFRWQTHMNISSHVLDGVLIGDIYIAHAVDESIRWKRGCSAVCCFQKLLICSTMIVY